uniref:C3H1-type domain-containing protein n=1 Tax=Amphora coffeiformis TaxID=265554 RepID=A0A7S3P915_9STRA
MEACFFGAGCTRPGCIYRHDRAAIQSNPQSEEPCMAYLAGHCAFNAKSCRKRHPPPAEADRLRQKYSQIRCRYGSECQTEGCLYRHEALSEPVSLVDWVAQPVEPARPPAAAALPGTSWRPTPPSHTSLQHVPLSMPPPPPPPPPPMRPVPPSMPPQPPSMRPVPPSTPPQPPSIPPQPPSMGPAPPSGTQGNTTLRPPSAAGGGFNINAKEFVPGGGFR